MKKILLLAVAVAVAVAGCGKNTYKGVLRLHIIGNSNSAYDQGVKLKVKDKVSVYMADKGVKSYREAMEIAKRDEADILAVANAVLEENGANYRATMETGVFSFPEKTYGEYVFKEGNYNAVRIKLGEAKGENWWCVMFPPICFLDAGNGDFDLNAEENVEFKSLLMSMIK